MFQINLAADKDSGGGPAISAQEIERKWRIPELPDLTGIKGKEVIQGYITIGADGTEVRIRQKGDKYYLTIKGDGGLVRRETETELSKSQFDTLWETTNGRRLEKTRYEIPLGELKIELDVYRGLLTGLMVAEVEFPSIRDSETFSAPNWFGSEVTEDKRFKNKTLAIGGIPTTA